MTIITTIINNTENVVVLREGQVGVLRKVCEIPAGKTHQVRSNLTATYKEYWCAVQPKGNDKFILTSDDCIDWKEIEIRPKQGDPTKFEWVGKVPASNKGAQEPGQGSESPSGTRSSHSGASSSFLARVLPKKVTAWLFKPKSSGSEIPPPENGL